MRIRLMIGDREAIGLRLWEPPPPPPANGEPAKTGAGLVSAERRTATDTGDTFGFTRRWR